MNALQSRTSDYINHRELNLYTRFNQLLVHAETSMTPFSRMKFLGRPHSNFALRST